MIGLSKFIFQITIILTIFAGIAFFDSIGLGSVLVAVGIFFIGTFISYLISGGRDLDDSNDSILSGNEVKNRYKKQPLLQEFNNWANASKNVINEWMDNTTDPFIKQSLLLFWVASIDTMSEFVIDVDLRYQSDEMAGKEYKNMIESLKKGRSEYLMHYLLDHIVYYHMYNFTKDYQILLIQNDFINFTSRSFLKKVDNAKNKNIKAMEKLYNEDLEGFGNVDSKVFVSDFLSLFGVKKNSHLLTGIAEEAFEKSYINTMQKYVDKNTNAILVRTE